ncbi:MAG TPA: carboxypeptidase-like regulatory domain-containing protein [Vicinamibacterales bacterium]|nr:carboxypeptidase-like regulatory domain-containing protein [Vicinamibacterales bacterium]
MRSLQQVLKVAGVIAVVLMMSSTVAAQTFTGGLRGTVRDANGVIPGVTVQLLNEATGAPREVVSNDQGAYNFAALPPGTYSVRAQLSGYKTFERQGLRVATQQFVQLDVILELGTIEETITVTGQSPLIDTTTASTGGVLDREALEVLPSPGRNAFLIGVTIPTVTPVGDPQFNRQQDQTNASRVSLGGGGVRANNYLLDGVPITELVGRAVLNPTIEALEEVRVQVHTYDAEMGRTGGGVFNVTAKSGTNNFHGSGFYQTRPVWGVTENFFVKAQGLSKEESGLDDTYYRLYGGGIGGPIWRNRTFFWTATEGYRSNTTRNERQIWPSAKQRLGDFSTSTVGGQPVQIFNPFCRGGVVTPQCPATGTGSLATGGLFTNAIIPRTHPAANPAGFGLLGVWPTQTSAGPISGNENNEPNAEATGPIVDSADMFTVKAEHRFTDRWSISGLYIYNKTDEPGSTIMREEDWFIASQDNFFGPLRRRPHVAVINNTNIINDTTVLTLRYGFSTWQDSCDPQPFSAGIGSLGFSPNYVNALAETDIFPSLSFDEVADVGGWGGSKPSRWKSPFSVNGTLSKLWGSHSLKVGADVRRLGIETVTESDMGGSFTFNRLFTSNAGVGGHELASILLGVPASGSVPFNRGLGEWFTTYYGGYIQDDWRVNQKLSVNFGVRFEHEDGLREVDDRQTVGFDQDVVSPLDALVPKTGLLAGRTIRGGLMFAGVDGNPTEQGNPAAVKVAPRGGFSYSINSQTVARGGYGLFYAPWNYSRTQHGQIGFSRTTSLNQADSTRGVPITTLDNPFPAGLQEPIGSSLGLLTGTGGTINYIDQNKGNPKVHQYSLDVQRELPGNMAITIGYVGATGRDIGFGGTGSTAININQIDPDVARAVFPGPNGTWNPAALLASVPNPFFGVPGTGEFGTRATIQAGQLLRPFPQFGNINQFERTEGGRRQYHAATFVLEKRTTGFWGGRFSYTLSRTRDNQFGESSTFQTRTATPQNNYDLDAEYAAAHFDSPHRLILAPIVRLPDSSSGNRAARLLLSGWSASAIVELVSGSPLNAVLSSGASTNNLGLFGGQQRPNLVGDPSTSGSDQDRVATAGQPDARFFNAAAFANPGAGTFGNAPRTISDARYQFRKNLDLVVTKETRFGQQTGEVRFELLNLTNTPKFRGIDSNSINLGSFGRITRQAGFMRIWQLSFRYKF